MLATRHQVEQPLWFKTRRLPSYLWVSFRRLRTSACRHSSSGDKSRRPIETSVEQALAAAAGRAAGRVASHLASNAVVVGAERAKTPACRAGGRELLLHGIRHAIFIAEVQAIFSTA